jgi:hypothetical protein
MVNNFQKHLYLANEGYFEHLLKAIGFSISLFVAATACLVHAFIPWLFETTASDRIRKLHKAMRRGNVVLNYADYHSDGTDSYD